MDFHIHCLLAGAAGGIVVFMMVVGGLELINYIMYHRDSPALRRGSYEHEQYWTRNQR